MSTVNYVFNISVRINAAGTLILFNIHNKTKQIKKWASTQEVQKLMPMREVTIWSSASGEIWKRMENYILNEKQDKYSGKEMKPKRCNQWWWKRRLHNILLVEKYKRSERMQNYIADKNRPKTMWKWAWTWEYK